MPLHPGLAVTQVTHKRIEGRMQKAYPRLLLSAFCLLLYTLFFILPAPAQAEKGQKQAPAGSSVSTSCPMGFTDVQSTDYFYQAVNYMYCHAVIGGYGDNTFR